MNNIRQRSRSFSGHEIGDNEFSMVSPINTIDDDNLSLSINRRRRSRSETIQGMLMMIIIL